MDHDGGEQLALVRTQVRPAPKPKAPPKPATNRPIAQVATDLSLPHLDRLFDYLVPAHLDAACVPGCRVKVRFSGQEVDGFVVARVDTSDHEGTLAPIRKVVSSEPVLAADVAAVARAVADRYAGTLADVLRLAVPPRHARAEKQQDPHAGTAPNEQNAPNDAKEASERTDKTDKTDQGERAGEAGGPGNGEGSDESDGGAVAAAVTAATPVWSVYEHGSAFVAALARGDAPRAVWTAASGASWPDCLAAAAQVTLASGRGVLIVVPDRRDATRVDEALTARLGKERHTVLTAELGPAERYRRFLRISRGQVRCVVGTRAAAFAPVGNLGLLVCWDDGDDLHAEPRAPYPQVREVLLLRARERTAGVLIGGFACTAEAAQLLSTGYASPLALPRGQRRTQAPRVVVTGDTDADLARDAAARAARIPHQAFEVARAGLTEGPVLVQVPRRGYVPALSCHGCRRPARCDQCAGPLQIDSAGGSPRCRWCARLIPRWRCPACGTPQVRAPVVGSGRTAEELGRAFPAVPVRTSSGEKVLNRVGGDPALIVATPGAEPVAEHGYAAALLLDGWLLLGRADLRAGEEAVRRWMGAAALVRPAHSGGTVVLMGEPGLPSTQALVRWSPLDHGERELADRRAAGFPPVVRLAMLEGPRSAVTELVSLAEFPEGVETLGPVPLSTSGPVRPTDETNEAVESAEDQVRVVVRVHRRHGAAMTAGLRAAQGVRSARKSAGTVRIRVDPRDLD